MQRIIIYLFSGFRSLFRRLTPNEDKLGQTLVKRGILTQVQLEEVLVAQRERLVETGQAVRLGYLITELGIASETSVIAAINDTYNLSVVSLSDSIREPILRKRWALTKRLSKPIVPIWLKLCIGALLIVTVTTFSFGYLIINKQKDRLFDQTVNLGTVSLNYFVNNARIPLIDDDILRLNSMIKEATNTQGLRYALVTNTKNLIRAHTDLDHIGTYWVAPSSTVRQSDRRNASYYSIVVASGEQILNLTRKVVFKDKILGSVHVGVSLDFIKNLVNREIVFVLCTTIAMLAIGLVIALFLGIWFSRPISQLVTATEAIGKGDYRHRVYLNRKDELGNLATAFNRMGEELLRHKLTRQAFGKYVGEDVLEMIVADPEKTWLKGHQNKATILFADIRGFTPYAEEREPTEVVEVLNTYFEVATRCILDYGGYVDKFIGDCVLGVFGVPVFRKDHTERAVRAALDLMDRLKAFRLGKNALLSSVGIGIHTGFVVSGNIGSQAKMEYTVIGDTVNLASRLTDLADAGEVLVSESVYDKIKPMVTAKPADQRMVRGKSAPVKMYTIKTIQQRSNVKSSN